VVHDQPQHEVDDNEDEVGGEMIVDHGELDETIVDEMELDDELYRTFVGGRDGGFFENETTIPMNGITFQYIGSQLMTGTIVIRCMIMWRSQEVRCFMTRCTCSMVLRGGLSQRRNHSRW
jgi:hypothetical protein